MKGYSFHHAGYNINLVDSPGFNDTYKSETEVLSDIATWLQESYENREKLSGIVYIHSIENVHMEGSALRNLRMFRELCGRDPLKNVIVVTSFWSNVAPRIGDSREEELRTTPEFWGEMIRRGSRMARFNDSRSSALDIIMSLVSKDPVALNIQRELVEQRKALVDTAAGQVVNEELARLEAKHRREKATLQRELQDALAQRDVELQEILEEQRMKMDEKLESIHRQQAQLKAERRADRRRLENQLSQFSEQRIDYLPNDNSQRGQNTRPPGSLAPQVTFRENDLDWVVSVMRANESKIKPEERLVLELKIEEATKEKQKLSKKLSSKQLGRVLLRAVQVALPVTTMALLGFPSFLPFSPNGSTGDAADSSSA